MKLKINISLDNAAFEEGNGGPEVARLLRELADRYEDCGLEKGATDVLFDLNGNNVGGCTVTR